MSGTCADSNSTFSYDDSATHFTNGTYDADGNLVVSTSATATQDPSTLAVATSVTHDVTGYGTVSGSYVSPMPQAVGEPQTITYSNGATLTRQVVDDNTMTATVTDTQGHTWNITSTTTDGVTFTYTWSGASSGSQTVTIPGLSTLSSKRSTSSMNPKACAQLDRIAQGMDMFGFFFAVFGLVVPMSALFALGFGAAGIILNLLKNKYC